MDIKSTATHRRTQHSTTLNRKYVTRPTPKVTPSCAKATTTTKAPKTAKPARSFDMFHTKSAMPTMKKAKSKTDTAVNSALHSVATMNTQADKPLKTRRVLSPKHIIFALACSAVVVALIFFAANQSMPDLSVRVAAMQTGIDASYPSYVPRDYSLSGVVSEEGKISMTFSAANGDSFTLTEKNSSWDSAALEANYVKSNFVDYTPIREQGLTLYVSGSDCAWVNGGKFYLIDASGNNLTKKQLKSIAVSL